jgi:hypothetical protein
VGRAADYFEYVMLANGRCQAPEAVALSRSLGRDLVPSDLRSGYPPAVRFYFSWRTLAARSDADLDGVHPVKIRQQLPLDDVLVAIVVHSAHLDSVAPFTTPFRDHLVVLDVDNPSPDEWAAAAVTAAESLI